MPGLKGMGNMALEGAHAAANLAGTSKLSADAKENIRQPAAPIWDASCPGIRKKGRMTVRAMAQDLMPGGICWMARHKKESVKER